jgi:hypothetical protein
MRSGADDAGIVWRVTRAAPAAIAACLCAALLVGGGPAPAASPAQPVPILMYHVLADAVTETQLFNWRTKVQALRPVGVKAFGSAEAYDAFAAEYLALLQDPDAQTYSVLFLVEGVRP